MHVNQFKCKCCELIIKTSSLIKSDIMPSAEYRPLDTGIDRPIQATVLRGGHGSKLRPLCLKTANSRRVFMGFMLLMILLVYVLWCAVANNTDDVRADSFTTADAYDNKLATELHSTPCEELFIDSRLYIQDKPRQEWDNLSTIFFVTPTYPRREQVPELTRLAYTLLHVPRLHWIVANDYNACNPYLDTLLNKFGIPFTHLASPMPERYRNAKSKPRGVANRRAAMQWLRQRNITSGVLYFGDDDNTYDLKLFREIRDTKIVSMFPVGLIASYGISGPVVRKGKVVGFLDSWVAGRRWPVDMAGFAVNLAYLAEYPNASMPFKPGYEEDHFLRSIALTLDKIEPKGNNCTEILVWHTQTKNHNREAVKISHDYLDNRSNLGALFKALAEMGVSDASDDEGLKAIISSNGKAKPLGYYLS